MENYEPRICHGWPKGSCSNLETVEAKLTAKGSDGKESTVTVPLCDNCAILMLENLTGVQAERHHDGEIL